MHIANTEQRVRFKEVQLTHRRTPSDPTPAQSGETRIEDGAIVDEQPGGSDPLTKKTVKGKERATVDLITGKSAPEVKRRGKRKKKQKEVTEEGKNEDEDMQLDGGGGEGEFAGLHRMDVDEG